ncbi:MAG: peptidyl-alpha-hydroxyglycine alpha-amidating lyase family protein [Pseudohongiellaceae bacterium]|nr:peptidyl-alpha-hydroxyglycine alpha-amidating lyase family protein [Pseudohongiellaceae bacterium]
MKIRQTLIIASLSALTLLSAEAQEYVLEENWPLPLPEGIEWGQVPNVTIDQDGFLYAFHRSDPPILKFSPQGELIHSWGTDLIATPHGFRAAPDGTLWATDFSRSAGHKVYQFDTQGNLLMELGIKGLSGNTQTTFNGPTDVAVSENGDIFIADGHWNNRIVKFNSKGHFLMEWGTRGEEPGQFNLPHSLVIDKRGRLLVADRGNERIQIFTQEGEFITQWDQFGWPSGLFIDENDILFVADYQDKRGVTYGSAETGEVLGFISGSEPEGVTLDALGNVYTGEVTGGEGGDGHIMRKFSKQ